MHFILISKKKGFNNGQINEKLLKSSQAPSLISREVIKYENSKFLIYLYPYDHIDHEIYGYSYSLDKNEIVLINGVVNVNNNLRNPDIKEFFKFLKDTDELSGDYQLISIDKNGNGSIITPALSIRQLFSYEDENCSVISSEIKLIVDGIQKFRKKSFINHFDPDFIEDAIFNEWTPRNSPDKTIFKEIKRILPYDIKYFNEGKLVIEQKHTIPIPDWFRDKFENDRNKLFDEYYQFLLDFTETNLIHLKPNIDKISLGLTGGFDSRITAAILSKISKKHQIPFECRTSGQISHPDIVIAEKVAEILKVKHIIESEVIRPNTKRYNDYLSTFYMSQGDFNSKDFIPIYKRKVLQLNVLEQLGMSGHKKDELHKIYTANRWIGRRILFQKNFFFPLFFTCYEIWFALMYAEKGETGADEMVYEILKRSNPDLLEIPFVGKSLSQTNVKPYLTVFDSKHHEKEPFLWDYDYVRKNLKPVLIKKFNNSLGIKSKIIFLLAGVNELDYFLNPKFERYITSYRKNRINLKYCINLIIKEGKSNAYPKTKTTIKMTKESLKDPFIPKMQILMDIATSANKYSFNEMERNLTFHV